MPGVVVFLLGGTLAIIFALFILIEMSFVITPGFSVNIMKCILLSQLVSFCIVLPTLLFTNHPWGGGVGVLGFVFLIPPSLVAAFLVRLLYTRENRPMLDRTVTLTIFCLTIIGILSWLTVSLSKGLSRAPSKSTATGYPQYSARDKSEAQAALDSYWSRDLIQRCRSYKGPATICVNGVLWKAQSKEMQRTVFRQFIRSYSVLGLPTSLDVIDRETGEVYATSRPGTTGIELELH